MCEAAYDAPFPDETFKAGARQFPMLVPSRPDDPAHDANVAAWVGLAAFERPFLCAFSDSDPITKGADRNLKERIAGAKGQPHTTIVGGGHFLQEDCGEDLAGVVAELRRRHLVTHEHDVVIVGAGFSGIGMAARLRSMGVDDFVVLDRGNDLGGTWRDNAYPGAACDVPSNLYSFSFALNPDWSAPSLHKARSGTTCAPASTTSRSGTGCASGRPSTRPAGTTQPQRWVVRVAGGREYRRPSWCGPPGR